MYNLQMRAVTSFDRIVESLQLSRRLITQLAQSNDIDVDIILLHSLSQLDKRSLRLRSVRQRRAGKDDDALALRLVLAMLECERGDHDGGMQVRLAADLCAVQALEDFARVRGEGGEDFGTGAAHAHQADGGFGVGLCFVLEEEVGTVCLCFPARGDVVAVSAALAVVHPE